MSKKSLKAYIAASATVDTTPVRQFLKDEGISSRDAYSVAPGSNLIQSLISRVRSADFAVAVLSHDADWTAYELGLCDAIGKPVLVIISPGVAPPPSVAAHPLVRTTIEDSDVWQLALQKFIDEVRGNRATLSPHIPRSSRNRANSERLKELADILHQERADATPERIDQLTHEILKAAAVTVVAQDPSLSDRGADFAVWDDSLARVVGLPLFIELKFGNLDPELIRRGERQLADAMQASSGALGLLLYLDRQGRRFPTPTWDTPYIVRFDLEDFANLLTRTQFARLIVDRRNKLVHGMG